MATIEVTGNEFTLRPSRSLTPKGKAAFYGSIMAAGALVTYFSVAAGMWPIAVFVDLTIAGAVTAMMLSNRSGREYEKIRLLDDKVEVRHYKPGFSEESVFDIPVYMLQVQTVCDEEGYCSRLLLRKLGKLAIFCPLKKRKKLLKCSVML